MSSIKKIVARDIHRWQQAMQHMMLVHTDFFEHFVIKFFTHIPMITRVPSGLYKAR